MTDFPTVIRVDNVSKRFVMHKDKSVKERLLNFSRSRKHRDDFWALRDVNFDIAMGSTVGLVGHNGSGKSTLLKAIGGIIQPTSGTVSRRGRLAALLELGAGFHPDLTGRENVYLNAAILGLTKQETDRHFDEIVEFSGIEDFIDTQVKFYSSGMYVRLAFAVAVHVDPDVLLVDEVLAVGDEPFQRKCMERIARFQSEGRTIVLVSHSADQVGSLCDRVIVLNSGNVVHDGDPAAGIRILRDGYEADRRLTEQLEHGVSTGHSMDYDIVSVDIENREVAERRDIVHNIAVKINKPTRGWGVGVSIDNSLGLRLFHMTTFGLDYELPNTIGQHLIKLTLPDLRLGFGKYFVNVGLGNESGTNFDQRPSAASFDMPGEALGYGLLRVSPEVEID
jgi:ABC-2 type transport system ATP-binding protein